MMPMNSNKRKGRPSGNNKVVRSKVYNDKAASYDGVYGNSRLMHAAAGLVGCVIQIQVRDGSTYEGILRTFSSNLEIVLEMAHKVVPKVPPIQGVGPNVSNLLVSYPFEGGISEKLIFNLNDVVTVHARNVDTEFAVKDNFTDSAISKYNGQIMEKELEPWEGASSDSESTTLGADEDDGANGWDANDMFRLNAEKYGVKSSYDNTLQEYTVPLVKKDTEDYRLKESKASKIAHEIEANTSYQSRLQLENGDEEDRFSAVVRTEEPVTKYVAPQKRRNNLGPKRQAAVTSMSPIHAAGGGNSKPYLNTQSVTPTVPSGQSKSTHLNSSPPPLVPSPNVPPIPREAAELSFNGGLVEDTLKASCASTAVENVPVLSAPPPKPYLCGPNTQTLPPRIERRRENERKFAKQKGRNDEIEEFRKFSSNFKLTEETKDSSEPREEFSNSETKSDSAHLASKLAEQVKIQKDSEEKTDISKSTLNPNAKEFVLNPNAKSFTPRSMPPVNTNPQPPAQPQRMQAQSPVIVVPHNHMLPGMPQTILTAFPQYLMHSAPVSMPLTNPFASLSQAPRYRKVPLTMQPRHELTPSMHVAAATGQPILAQPTLHAPSQLAMPYNSQQIQTPQQMGYPQMNFVMGPRVVSPQPVGVVPTSHGLSYCDNAHMNAHLIMSAHPGPASLPGQGTTHNMQQAQHSNHHPPQSQTPVLHPSPSPVHQVPTPHGQSHPPTPTTVMYPAGPMGSHPLQTHHQPLSHPGMHQAHHHPAFGGGPQPLVLMQQQQQSAAGHHGHHQQQHHPLHLQLHSQAGAGNHIGTAAHLMTAPQMTIIPTSATMAPTTISTPPY